MRTANPALNKKTFSSAYTHGHGAMTIDGTVNKTFMLLFLVIASSAYTWWLASTEYAYLVRYLIFGGIFGGFILAMITIFKKEWSPVTAPFYAIFEGAFLGAISALFERMFPGIVIQAIALTFGTLLVLLFAYKSGLIKATENFKLGIVAATGAIALIYIVSLVMSFFGTRIPYIHESGWIGIGFSLFVVTIAALNLVLDFDFIEKGAASGAPKYLEWYASFGLLVTLIWLYLEILRLLAKTRSSR